MGTGDASTDRLASGHVATAVRRDLGKTVISLRPMEVGVHYGAERSGVPARAVAGKLRFSTATERAIAPHGRFSRRISSVRARTVASCTGRPARKAEKMVMQSIS